jgi:hypothetical protein
MERSRFLAFFLFGLAFIPAHEARGVGAPPPAAPRKRALLVGIDQYRSPQLNDLQGCVNDVQRMKDVLTRRFGFAEADVTVLTDERATRDAIIAALQALARAAEPGDIVVVHYSGHGATMRDVSGDELDGRDETIVPHDSREPGIFDLSDDELNGLLRELSRKTPNVTVVLDSCHSGSATRGGATVRQAPDDTRDPPAAPAPFAWSPRGISEGPDDLRPRDSRYVLITGCKPHQLSNEFEADGRRFGALTYHLTRALDGARPGATYRDVMDLVGGQVRTLFPTQEPDLEGARADAPLFSGAEPVSAAYVLVSPGAQGRAEVAAGRVYGLGPGSVIDVYAPDAADFTGAPAARVRLVNVEGFRAEADVVEGTVAPLSRGVLRELSYAEPKLRLCYVGLGGSPALQRTKAELDAYAVVQATADERTCDLRLLERDGQILTEAGDLAPRGAPIPANAGDAVTRIRERVLGWARWFAVLRLANPSPGVEVRLQLGDPAITARAFAPGDQVDVYAENRSDRDLYLNLLDLASDGSVELVYPPAGASERLPARTTGKLTRLQFFVPDGEQVVTDTLKLFATSTPLDARLFRQGAVRSGEAASMSADPLANLLDSAFLGKTRNARPVNLGGWTTAQDTLVVSRSATPVVSPAATPGAGSPGSAAANDTSPVAKAAPVAGFVLHLRQGTRGTRGPAPNALAPCPASVTAETPACWKLQPMDPAGTTWEAVPAGRGASRAADSLAASWDEAYRIRQAADAERVEPSFELDETSWGIEDEPATRGGRSRPDKQAARDDPLWSLKHIRAFDAWNALHATGRADGDEGASVTVAHPDTGYREHPELWDADESRSRVLFTKGYDFFGDDANPFDELDTGGIVPNPGHGTKSGSVIVSPKGKQWMGGTANEFVTGVAPGAHLVPLRVNRSVVHFFPGRLAKAIHEAARGDSTFVRAPTGVVSISMGGAPSWGLWKAVRYAQSRGVIVVSAAGNEVGFVVWPARFKETVAVAATNVECGTWEGSSKGDAVDIAAPGESVWRASTDPGGIDSVGMGQGTTFATATTAGVAALWLDRHRRDPKLAELKQKGAVTAAFRDILQRTSWRPDQPPAGIACASTSWDRRYGAGIVDAAAALAAPLPSPPATRAVEAEEFDDLPLFSTLFPAGTPPQTAQRRYRRLLRTPAGRPGEADVELEAEITMHYALDPGTRAALDALTGAAEPDDAAFERARQALRGRDVSQRLRTALQPR